MDLTPVLIATGLAFVIGGVALALSPPVALIVAGVLMVALAVVSGPKVER